MAFGRESESLLRNLRDEHVVQSPAEVEAALEMEKLLRPNPEHAKKRSYLSGAGDKSQDADRTVRGFRPARIRVGRGGTV